MSPRNDGLSPYVSIYMARSQAEELVKWAHLAQAKLPKVAPRNARTALQRIESALSTTLAMLKRDWTQDAENGGESS